jgi:predicted Zn-dependent protease
MFGQHNEEKQIKIVFNQLLTVYGSAKSAPKLELIKKGKFPIRPANYLPSPEPKIQIDVALYKVCQTFGKDSLNALAVVLSHELTHYFNDHTFCSDYAFANLKKQQPNLTQTIKSASLSARIEKESEADIKGFFYAAAAGFEPHNLQAQLIDLIYKTYNLPDIQNGYPSRQERRVIAQSAEKTASELYIYFQNGLLAMESRQYDVAITHFNNANRKIPFRENLNNIGVAKARKALLLKEKTREEYESPDRFLYPLEIENKSRLNKETTRSLDDNSEAMEKLLKEAQKDFQEAIRLDPNFTKGYINLACVMDLLEDPNGAISIITKQLLPKDQRESIDAQRILAIAYSHNGQEQKAEEIWKELGK